MVKIPKDIATMTDSEHAAWIDGLTGDEQYAIDTRTFRVVEWLVHEIDDDGDSFDCRICDTRAEAEHQFARLSVIESSTVVMEKSVKRFNVIDRYKIDDQDYETVKVAGSDANLKAGGWS